jgi:hypothetical protein
MIPENIDNDWDTLIATTTKNKISGKYDWTKTNPKAFSEWFNNINATSYKFVEKEYKQKLLENNKELFFSIDDVPRQLVKTNLQKIIQLLKRHRDLRFKEDEMKDSKPMSMIITTLVTQSYLNLGLDSNNLIEMLNKITKELCKYEKLLNEELEFSNPLIKKEKGIWYIKNPVADENLADRWHEKNNRKARAFFKWIKWLEIDFSDIEKNNINEEMNFNDYINKKNNVEVVKIDGQIRPWGNNV